MTKTSIAGLVGTAVFMALAALILTSRFYGLMQSIPPTVSVTLWIMTVICGVLAWKVYQAKKDDAHGIGLDNSQLNPMTVTQFMLVGKASAWTGAIVGGAYTGIAAYVVMNSSQLVAAQEDVFGVVTSALGGAALSVAGVILERHCQVPPTSDGSHALG